MLPTRTCTASREANTMGCGARILNSGPKLEAFCLLKTRSKVLGLARQMENTQTEEYLSE